MDITPSFKMSFWGVILLTLVFTALLVFSLSGYGQEAKMERLFYFSEHAVTLLLGILAGVVAGRSSSH
jgi:hypothetical protein